MNKLLLTFLLSISLLVAGCGGGGGDASLTSGPQSDDGIDTQPTVPDPDPVAVISVGIPPSGANVLEATKTNLDSVDSTELTVYVYDQNGDIVGADVTGPLTVEFKSNCIQLGYAEIDPPAPQVITTGSASVDYVPKGCGIQSQPDSVIATVVGGEVSDYAEIDLTVAAPTANSIQYILQDPIPVIGLAGTGLDTEAQLQFKVVDTGGNALPDVDVDFALENSTGDTAILPASAVSNSDGEVTVTVTAGTVHDSVRVRATVNGTSIDAVSSQLFIGTGLPAQDAVSLSTCPNIEGWDYDLVQETISVVLSDRFGNPAPEGTSVVFTSEGAQVEPGCSTEYVVNETGTAAFCSVNFTSANPRPDGSEGGSLGAVTNQPRGGRISVLAHANGEEAFIDVNGSGTFDTPDYTALGAGSWENLGEMFVDSNEDGTRQNTELFVDGDNSGAYSTNNDVLEGAPRFNGVGCEATGFCSTNTSTKIGDNIVMVLSTSHVGYWESDQIYWVPTGPSTGYWEFDATLGSSLVITIYDENENAMPHGTEVSLVTSNGETFGATKYEWGCGTEPGDFSFIIQPDEDDVFTGSAQILVETPRENVSVINFVVRDGVAP